MKDFTKLIIKLPESYVNWLDSIDESARFNDLVLLYSQDDLPERNATYEIYKYLPNHLLIGDDSGGRGILLRRSMDSAVYIADLGGLQPDDLVELATSFSKWQESGFKLPKEKEHFLPLVADIYVDCVPDLKTLFAIKKMLGEPWPVSKMRDFLNNQPFLAKECAHPNAIVKDLEKQPELKPYLFFKLKNTYVKIASKRPR